MASNMRTIPVMKIRTQHSRPDQTTSNILSKVAIDSRGVAPKLLSNDSRYPKNFKVNHDVIEDLDKNPIGQKSAFHALVFK